jgi:nitrate/TMAO reductase-like tetraheme cytochrome c subunit
MESFRAVFLTVVVAVALVVVAVLFHMKRPSVEKAQPTASMVRATGKCASCHEEETGAIVAEYRKSRHAQRGVTCLDCHAPAPGQDSMAHRGFTIATKLTAKNCAGCHADEYRQFLRSRHAAPAFAAIHGSSPFTEQEIDFAERFHPGAVKRPPNGLAALEGDTAIQSGCESCHSIGRPNADGSIGTCTDCHARHAASVALARRPRTCGQCHMGPDHSQIEIYEESKHGVLFEAQQDQMNLSADPSELTTADMPVPTCATCHMSGLDNLNVTHDVTERLSWWLFAPISKKRPTYEQGQAEMQRLCDNCHTDAHTKAFYARAEKIVASTNARIAEATALMDSLRQEGVLTPKPFDEPIEFTYFDLWHYYGRTAKHGAFMGGADFVQWHGNYELLNKMTELRADARRLREEHAAATRR